MGFIKKMWTDRKAEFARRRRITKVSGDTYDVERAEGLVSEEGDKLDAENLNDLETRIADGFAAESNARNQLKTDTDSKFATESAARNQLKAAMDRGFSGVNAGMAQSQASLAAVQQTANSALQTANAALPKASTAKIVTLDYVSGDTVYLKTGV